MPTSQANSPWLKNLPNQLTITRILTVPLLLCLYPLAIENVKVFCAFIFALAGITDILDGYFARLYKQESRIGALLDPVADKMLSGACLILLADSDSPPAFICGFLLCRDIAVTGMRLVALEDGFTIPVSKLGKAKTIIQDVAIFCLLIGTDIFDIPFREIGMISIWLALFVSLYSGYAYLMDFLDASGKNPAKNI